MGSFANNSVILIPLLVIFTGFFAVFTPAQTRLTANNETVSAGVYDPNSPQNALALQDKAQALSKTWNRESLQNAIILFLDAARHWRQSGIGKNAVFCLRKAGELQQILGDRKEAYSSYIQALKLADRSKLDSEKLKVLSNLALFYFLGGNFEKGNELLTRAQILEKNVNDFSARAEMLVALAEFNRYKRNLEKSVRLYKEAIICWQKARDTLEEARSLLNLGYIYMIQGEYNAGLKTLEDALSRWKTEGDKRGEALTYIAIGHMNTALSDKNSAFEAYRKAEQFFPEDLDFNERAVLNNGLCSIYMDYGEWKLAFSRCEKALKLFQKENNLYGQLVTLSYIGRVSHFTGYDDLAFEQFSQAENIASKLNDYHTSARIKAEIGNLYFENGSHQKAFDYYKQSLKYYENNKNTREMALITEKLGQIYIIRKEYELARRNFLFAIELHRRFRDKFAESQALFNLASLDKIENKNESAQNQIEASLGLTETLYSDTLNSKLKGTYFSNIFDRYELYINLLMKMHKQSPNENYAIRALQAAEKARARSMLETLSLSGGDFTKDAVPETVKREKEIRVLLNAKADRLTGLLSQNSDQAEIDKFDLEIRELENELEEIKAKFKQTSPIYSAIKNPAPFDVDEFQNRVLDDNTLLLEFSLGKEESYLWLVSKNEVDSYVLPPREQIESRVQKLRELLDGREMKADESIENYQTRITEAEKTYWQEAQILSREMFGQIAERLGEKRLIIVADGKVHYFPVSALPYPNSERNEPILLTNEVIYEPSASMLLLLAKNKFPAVARDLLVFSDPVFSGDDSRLTAKNMPAENPDSETTRPEDFRFVESLNSLARLTASKEEADSIINITGSPKEDSFSGFEANREQFLNANVSDYKIIHFATHGLIDEQRPELSGIVLSRFNEKGQKLNEFVRLQDIYGVNLNADLVVLSACNTGVGKEVKGEGLLSLNNAFLQVGARSVVSSLWKVDDQATLELMKNFYQAMAAEKATPAQALRQAQIKMWRSRLYKSPFYWAAFTMQGDFKRSPDFSSGRSYLIYAGMAVFSGALLLLGIYRFFRSSRANY